MSLRAIVPIAALFVLSWWVVSCQGSEETLALPTAAPTAALANAATLPPTRPPENTATLTPTEAAAPAEVEATATATETAVPPTATAPPLPTNTPIPTPAGPPNLILYIVVDSLRADHVSSYGYERPTTPNMDAWMGAQGMQFNQAIASASWTCPSNAALMSGLIPTRLGSTYATMGNALPRETATLAEYLNEAGYYTAGIVSNPCLVESHGFAQGFDYYDDSVLDRPQVDEVNRARGEDVNNRVWTWLQEAWFGGGQAGQPLFLFVYYMDPHVRYEPPPPYDTLYDPDYTGPFTPELFHVGREVLEGSLVPDERDTEHIKALYDGEITYWDSQLGNLLPALDGQGMLENALIVITADHGDMFGEHGTWVHGTSLYEGVIRVPLLMRYPGRIPVGQVDTPVQSMDLMPTILELAGIAVPAGLDAISLAPAFRGEALPQRDIFSEVDAVPGPDHWAAWIAPDTNLRSVQRNDWKLIQHVGDEAANELYQLQARWPYEVENVVGSEAQQAAELQGALDERFR